jgi:serine/threonine protein phosphatase PrpC
LHGSVPHADIAGALALATQDQLEQVCGRLIGMAKAFGGRDNITVMLALCECA